MAVFLWQSSKIQCNGKETQHTEQRTQHTEQQEMNVIEKNSFFQNHAPWFALFMILAVCDSCYLRFVLFVIYAILWIIFLQFRILWFVPILCMAHASYGSCYVWPSARHRVFLLGCQCSTFIMPHVHKSCFMYQYNVACLTVMFLILHFASSLIFRMYLVMCCVTLCLVSHLVSCCIVHCVYRNISFYLRAKVWMMFYWCIVDYRIVLGVWQIVLYVVILRYVWLDLAWLVWSDQVKVVLLCFVMFCHVLFFCYSSFCYVSLLYVV